MAIDVAAAYCTACAAPRPVEVHPLPSATDGQRQGVEVTCGHCHRLICILYANAQPPKPT